MIEALTTQMAEADPQAEIVLNFICPECNQAWQALFDIVAFLWAKISRQAQRHLQDVHTLARAYGWAEADILSLSPVRRQFYLNTVT